MSIASNLDQIRSRIAAACLRAGRRPEEVRLVAVSKTQPPERIEAAAAAGQLLFGENYVQELLAKIEAVQSPVEWHFIGALQSNKVKYLAGRVTLLHSVDRLSLAQEVDRQWGKLGRAADVLLQVNLGSEATKAGTDERALEALARQVAQLPHVRLRGLMALPPYCEDPEAVRPFFRRLCELSEGIAALRLPGVEMKELSMGMSHDFEAAVEEGATLVRVGTAIFGERRYR
jgi:hypothetical protein